MPTPAPHSGIQSGRDAASGAPPGALMEARRRSGIASATAMMAGAFLVSRVLGVVKNSVLYGTTPSADLNAFITAFKVPDLIFLMLSGGALTSALIPSLTGSFTRGDEKEAWQTATAVFNILGVVLIVASGLAFLLAPLYCPWLLDGSPSSVTLTVHLTRIMLLQPISLALGSVLMGLYNAEHRFLTPAVAPLLYNVAFIGGALLVPRFGVDAAAWGVSLGGCAQLAVQVVGLRGQVARYYRPVFDLADRKAREIITLMGPRLFGQVGLQLTLIVTTRLANSLGDNRVNPVLTAAFTLVTLPVGIFAAAIAVASFPTFAEQASQGQTAVLRTTVSTALRRVLFLTIPSAVGLALLAPHVVALLFGYGHFGMDEQMMTVWAFLFYAIALPAHGAVEVLPRAFFALRNTRTPVAVNLCTLTLVVVLSWLLLTVLPTATAYRGLALALSAGVALEAVWLAVLLRRRLGGLDGAVLGTAVGRMCLASAAMEGILLLYLHAVEPHLPASRLLGDLPITIGGVILGGGTYLLVAHMLGAEEIEVVRGMVLRRLRVRARTA